MVIFALIAGLLGVGVAAVSLALFLSYKGTTTTQIRQLREALASAQQSNQAMPAASAGCPARSAALTASSAFAPYTTACSQALVNQSGGTGPTTIRAQLSDPSRTARQAPGSPYWKIGYVRA